MSPQPSLKRNFLLNGLLNLVNILYPLLILSYVARVIGPASLGKFYFASSLAAYFLLMAGLGIPLYGAREAARARSDRRSLDTLFSELFVLNLLGTLGVTAIFALVVASVPDFRREPALFAVMGALVFANVFNLDFLYQGLENYLGPALRSVAAKLATLGLIFWLVRDPSDYLAYAAISVGGNVAQNLLAWPWARKQVTLRFTGLNLGRHLRPLATVSASTLLVSAYVNLDSVLLGVLSSEHSVGLFNAGIRIVRMALALLISLGVVLVPRLAYFLEEGRREEYLALLGKSMEFILLTALPAALFTALAAPLMVRTLFGEAFAEATVVLRLAAPLLVLSCLNNFLAMHVLFPNRRERAVLLASLAAAATSILLILGLVPVWAEKGAALAALAAEAVALALNLGAARRGPVPLSALGRALARYAGASLAMLPALAVVRLPLHPAAAFAAMATLAGLLYAGALLLLRDRLAQEMAGLLLGRLGLSRRTEPPVRI